MNILRERMRAYLSENGVGVLSISGGEGTWAMPVRYRAENLELDCLVPSWTDIAYHVERCSDVLLVILSVFPTYRESPLCWLQYKGNARPVAHPSWTGLLPEEASQALAEDMYLVLRIVPERIDLVDERRGWGARETLEIGDVHL